MGSVWRNGCTEIGGDVNGPEGNAAVASSDGRGNRVPASGRGPCDASVSMHTRTRTKEFLLRATWGFPSLAYHMCRTVFLSSSADGTRSMPGGTRGYHISIGHRTDIAQARGHPHALLSAYGVRSNRRVRHHARTSRSVRSSVTPRASMQEPANENELPAPAEFRIESEDVVYDRYMTIYNRRVIFPRRSGAQVAHVADAADVVDSTDSHRGHDGEEIHEFDVVGHPKANFHFVVAFPYHPPSDPDAHWSDGSVTLIREYAQVRTCLMFFD